MAGSHVRQVTLTPDLLIRAYAMGLFPMAESRESDDVHWIDPPFRGIFPLPDFHISRSLRRAILTRDYDIRINSDFRGTISACGERSETWINTSILDSFIALHKAGFAHSVEVWDKDGLIGGVYGMALGSAFFGESMFSRKPNMSKIALAWLVHRLRQGGFTLFDTQFLTPHLQSLGAIEITKADYLARLARAIGRSADFAPDGYAPNRQSVIRQFSQDRTQTS